MDSTDQLARIERTPAPRTVESGARTRENILATAERLFAARGFDGVSMRQIGLDAGVPFALVSYHFKSKLGLYRAVFRAHVDALTNARVAALERFRPSDDPRETVRALVLILVQPMIEMAAAPGGRDFVRLIAREANEPLEAERGVLAEFIDPVARLVIAQLERAFPGVEKATVHWAFLFASGALAINHAATGRIERLSGGLCRSEDASDALSHLVNFVTGGILAAFETDRTNASKRRASQR